VSESALANRDFRLLQGARLFSIVGTQMQSVAVGWQVYDLTRRPLDLGYVGLAQFLPAIGLSLVTGQAADRFDRRRVVLACHAAVALCSMLLLTNTHGVGAIYAILVLFGATRAFMAPAAQSLVTNIVPDTSLGSAVAVSSTVFEIGTIIGPTVGGLAYGAAGGPRPVYATTFAFSLVAFALVSTMRVRTGRMEKKAVSWETLVAGIRYVFSRRIVLGSISLDLFAVLLGGAVALLPAIARDVLHTGPWGLGLLRSAPAVGAGAMAILLAWRPIERHAGRRMLWGVLLFGVGTIAFGLSKNLWVSLAALALIGGADMVSVVVRLTLVQIATPPAMRGRVNAVNMIFVGASNELGEFESGVTAAWLGVVPSVVVGGIGTLVVVVLWRFLFPELAKVDRLSDEAAAADQRAA
jgi:MFS family permease